MTLLLALFTVPAHAQEEKPKRTILLILDGLASGAIDRVPLTHLQTFVDRQRALIEE
mgnify:FL=1